MSKLYINTGEVTSRVRYGSVDISNKFTQMYDDISDIIFSVGSPCALHLIFWMVENMGDYNQISMNKSSRANFISDCVSKGSRRYKDPTIKSALKTLMDKGIITSMNDKGKRESTYFISPFHFWKTNSQKNRAESIKGYIHKLNEK